MSAITDTMELIFGGGGGGGDPSASSDALLAWFRQQKAEQEQLDEREQAMADAGTMLRRNELADRPGYSGTVQVGDAAQRSDDTLAAQMAELAPDSPERQAYEAALAQENEQTASYERTASGEQFKAEDAFKDIQEQIAGGADPDSLQAQLDALAAQYSWYDASSVQSALDEERERRRREAEAGAAGPAVDPNYQYSQGGGV